jgi:hypothetical protein
MSGTFSGLCAGVYTVTVQSSSGCTGIYTVQVVTPSFMTINVNKTEPTPGASDGAFTCSVTGGTSPYEYSIDNQVNWSSNPTFSNLAAGVYLTYTKDANTCTQVTAVKLGQSTADVIEIEENLLVYPNPTNGKVFIEGSIEQITVADLNGRTINCETLALTNGMMADLNAAPSGIYFLSIQLKGTVRIVKITKE